MAAQPAAPPPWGNPPAGITGASATAEPSKHSPPLVAPGKPPTSQEAYNWLHGRLLDACRQGDYEFVNNYAASYVWQNVKPYAASGALFDVFLRKMLCQGVMSGNLQLVKHLRGM